jgi:hypothetical protein
MKTIGMIGGMSWESSIEYYRLTNQAVRQRLGGVHSAKSVMVSVDFSEIEALQQSGRWDEAASLMVRAARQVERGGADFLIICTNTMHRMAEEVSRAISIPLLHIADATAEQVLARGFKRSRPVSHPLYDGRRFLSGQAGEQIWAGSPGPGAGWARPGPPGHLRRAGGWKDRSLSPNRPTSR